MVNNLRKGTDVHPSEIAPRLDLVVSGGPRCRGTWRIRACSAGHCSQQGWDWGRRCEVGVHASGPPQAG